MFLTKQVKKKNGREYAYWIIKETVWDRALKRTRQKYIASIGRKRTITKDQAQRICREKGISIEEFSQVRRLKIIDGEGVA